MRKKIVTQSSLFDQAIELLSSIFKPDKKLAIIDQIIQANPSIIEAVHFNLTESVPKTGRIGISAERVLRSGILKQYKRYSYRELRERIQDCMSFRKFTHFYSDEIPHYTNLQKAIKMISGDTWSKINEVLVAYSKSKKIETGKSLRIDTTVSECNISFPVDARLLNDSVRVLSRIMERSREVIPGLKFNFSKRTKRAKKICYKIVMSKGRNVKERRCKLYKELLKVSNEVYRMGMLCSKELLVSPHIEAIAFNSELKHYLNLFSIAISQCERRIIKGEKVPASEKIVSIFEEHTDIIKRGKSQCPTEFGHKVLITTGKSGLITYYQSFRGNPCDGLMLPDILTTHKKLYGQYPKYLAGDRRFFSTDNENLAYEKGVAKVSICKPGYRSKDRRELEKSPWFKKLQKFRAGIEGIISALMRGYGLKRCLWKGWESFQSYVGLSVVTFNLQKMATLL
ncbi:MAG: ISNCY family transposase [Candidatus Omnitrophota bacterium]